MKRNSPYSYYCRVIEAGQMDNGRWFVLIDGNLLRSGTAEDPCTFMTAFAAECEAEHFVDKLVKDEAVSC